MRVFPYQDGDQLIELVEKLEYDAVVLALHDMTNLLDSEKSTRNHLIKRGAELERELDDMKSQRADFGALVDKLERELNAAVRRMNDVPAEAIEDAYWSSWKPYQNIRNLFIQAAKGEQPCATHREQMNLF